MTKRALFITLVLSAVAMAVVGAGYTLFGGAAYVMPGNASNRAVQLTSNTANATTADDYSGIDFAVPAGMKFSDVAKLSTDYNFTHNSCGGGSPRFQINVVTPSNVTKNVFVYIGPAPSYTNCTTNLWTSTGNLVAPGNFLDTGQLDGGTFYDTFAAADTKYGAYPVTGIQLVVDASWFFTDGTQTVLVDNVMINDDTHTFEPTTSGACKDGGWKTFSFAPGPFKNQGDCVSYFATGGRNAGNGQ
ncbi:MAG: hypothetical protein LAQ30_15675 [Acidobacteriia bacterium]|nr:hypothetical protein [Terriglobia bacterium]